MAPRPRDDGDGGRGCSSPAVPSPRAGAAVHHRVPTWRAETERCSMAAFQPITEAEAMALTRRQLLTRVEQTQAWLDRPPNTAAKRAAGAECSRVMFAHLKIGAMLDSTTALVRGQLGAGVGYMDERVDGSPPRPPTRVRLSRQRSMPYGCRNVARPGPYGNPFTVAE